jgi:DNA polymerase
MNIITVDFESAYGGTLGFRTQTTEEYIRDPRFEVIGVAVQVNNGEPVWFSGTHQKMYEFLNKYDWKNSLALAHNAIFDGAILNWQYGITPKGWLDTLSMGRASSRYERRRKSAVLAQHYNIGVKGDEVVKAEGKFRKDFSKEELARYGDYCKNDVKLTWDLFGHMSQGFPKIELRLIDLTVRMFTEPMLQLDKDILERHLGSVQGKKKNC